MLKMSQLGTAIRSNCFSRSSQLKQGLPLLLRDSSRRFSTEPEQPQDSSSDRFLSTPSTGCNLTLDDVKVDYDWNFIPTRMMVQLPSQYAFNHAMKMINKKGRLYRWERADRSQWDIVKPYNGKAVLLQGIPRNALQDDIDRFLSGCEFDGSSIQLISRQTFPDFIRMAIVRFPSQTEAMNAFITKNRGFCLNNQISMRVLQ